MTKAYDFAFASSSVRASVAIAAPRAVTAMPAVSPVVMVSLAKVESLEALTTTPVGMMPVKALSSKLPIRWLKSA